jgi:hypothetical protein
MSRSHCLLTLIATFSLAGQALPDEGAAPLSALARMPVKEVTIFKDGHAFVLHEGKMPTSPTGNVELDYLPTPVIGTFWPYSSDKKARLTSVVAAKRRVLVEQTALGLRDLLEGNVGADIIVNEGTAPYPATIVGFPTRTSKELEATSPPQTDPPLPQKGELILLKTAEGTKAVNLNRIVDVKFLNKYKTTLANEEFRNLLTLKLDWADGKSQPAADVGLMYLQQGMRWIPNYLVELDGSGKATVKLQATLLNEMTDLDNVTVNLVVGVPSFLFKDTIDPMALGQTLARLTTYMESDQRLPNNYSNSIMTQGIRTNDPSPRTGSGDLGPEVAGGGKNEDLFLFTVHGITLKKGQRAVVPVAQYALEYKDLYTLDLPFAPPPELHNIVNDSQRAELARLLSAPKVEHKIRLVNKNSQPLTTAPTLIVNKGRVLAQSMMTYTSAGGYTDLPVTAAVDIKAKKSEKEAKRSPNAAEWNGQHFWRLDLAGSIHLCNLRGTAAELEVTRYVLGNVNEADHQGKTEMVNVLEDTSFAPASAPWLSGYNWPVWWQHFNGVGRITWNLKLDPGASVDLGYTWHYFRN